MWQVRVFQAEAVDERSVYIIYMYNPLCCEIMKFFTKKDDRTLADSEKVATFASAFEKQRFLQISREFTIKELEMVLSLVFSEMRSS